MLDAAVSALSQMFTPPFRAVLWKSVALAVAILIALSYPLVLLPLRFYLPAERRRLRGLFGSA